MATRVIDALRGSCGLNAGTPLETASTPDSATAPDEKARMRMKRVMPAEVAPGLARALYASSWPWMGPRLEKYTW